MLVVEYFSSFCLFNTVYKIAFAYFCFFNSIFCIFERSFFQFYSFARGINYSVLRELRFGSVSCFVLVLNTEEC